MKHVFAFLLSFGLLSIFAPPATAQSKVVSILGKDVAVERVQAAYVKVRERYVLGDNMRVPVSESAYVKAWEETKRRRDAAEREREQARRNNGRNGRSGTTRPTRPSSVKISAATTAGGMNINDKNKPEFDEIIGVVVKPGRDAVVRTEKGKYYLIECKSMQPVTGNARFFFAKRDPDRKEHRMRTPKGELTMAIYEDYTISPNEFMSVLRKGMYFSELPELKRNTPPSQLGKPSSTMKSKGGGFGSRESQLGKGSSIGKSNTGGGFSNRKDGPSRSGTGFAEPRTTTIRR